MLVSAQTKILLWMVEACVKRNHHLMPEAGGGLRGRGLYGKKSRKKPFIVFQRHALNDTVCTDFVSQTSPTFSGYLHPGKQAPTHEVLGRQATYTTLWMESTIPAHFDLQVFQLWIILLIKHHTRTWRCLNEHGRPRAPPCCYLWSSGWRTMSQKATLGFGKYNEEERGKGVTGSCHKHKLNVIKKINHNCYMNASTKTWHCCLERAWAEVHSMHFWCVI